MKQNLPQKSFAHSTNRFRSAARIGQKSQTQVRTAARLKVGAGILSGLMLSSLAFSLFSETPFWFTGTQHQLKGQVFVDQNRNHSVDGAETGLPFVKINVYSDLNENQQLDKTDLYMASALTDWNGTFDLSLEHGQSLVSRINSRDNEAREISANGWVDLAPPILSLGGEDNISGITALRFERVFIPANAQIEKAFLRFRSYSNNEERPILQIYSSLEKQGFVPENQNLSARKSTGNGVEWIPEAWEKDRFYVSPNLSEIVKANLKNTDLDQTICFFLEGNGGIKEACSSLDYAPQLIVHYQVPSHPYLIQLDSTHMGKQADSVTVLPFESHTDISIPYNGAIPLGIGMDDSGAWQAINFFSGACHPIPSTFANPHRGSIRQLSYVPEKAFFYGLKDGKLVRLDFKNAPKIYEYELRIQAFCRHPYTGQIWALCADGSWLFLEEADDKRLSPFHSRWNLPDWEGTDVKGLAIDAEREEIHLLAEHRNKGLLAWKLKLGQQKWEKGSKLNSLALKADALTGMEINPNGEMMLVYIAENQEHISWLDPKDMRLLKNKPFHSPQNLQNFSWLKSPPAHVQSTVVEDQNGNGKADPQEPGISRMKFHIYEDLGIKGTLDSSDLYIQTIESDSAAQVHWYSQRPGAFWIKVDENSLPAGLELGSKPAQLADLRSNQELLLPAFLTLRKNQLDEAQWLGFELSDEKSYVQLNWLVTPQPGSGYFQIMRSLDGMEYHAIGEITFKENTDIAHYSFKDHEAPQLGTGVLAYRIKKVNTKTDFFYSPVAKIDLNAAQSDIQITAIPIHRQFVQVRYKSKASGKARLQVRNLAGKLLIEQSILISQKEKRLEIPAHNWPSGIYYFRIESGELVGMKKVIIP